MRVKSNFAFKMIVRVLLKWLLELLVKIKIKNKNKNKVCQVPFEAKFNFVDVGKATQPGEFRVSLVIQRGNYFYRHLGKNPFICDCNLRWLSVYLRANPIETSGAKCELPKRAQKKKIDTMRDDKFKCKGKQALFFDRFSVYTLCYYCSWTKSRSVKFIIFV